MAIPRAAYPAPFNTTRASHAILAVKDLGASRAFYVDALGFAVSDEDANTLYLRGIEEACHHSLVLKRTTDAPAAERVGLRVYTEDDLEKAKAHFERAGLPAAWVERAASGTDAACARCGRHAAGILRDDGDTAAARGAVQTSSRRVSARIDHMQVLTTDVQKACEFYSALGFRMSEFIAVDNTDEMVFIFLQRKGNPHDIVFVNGIGPRFHHAAFAVPDASHILTACDIAGVYGFGENLEFGPGRHGPGHALFAYFRDPDGHRVELFNTHYQMMDIENEPVRWDLSYMRNRPWGFPPRRSRGSRRPRASSASNRASRRRRAIR